MNIEKFLAAALLLLLVTFGVLNAIGVQPGEDNNRWLLYLFLVAWPLLSLATLVGGVGAIRPRRIAGVVALVVAVVSLAGFAAWGRMYAGLW